VILVIILNYPISQFFTIKLFLYSLLISNENTVKMRLTPVLLSVLSVLPILSSAFPLLGKRQEAAAAPSPDGTDMVGFYGAYW
jgi:hypothetical protein